MDSKVVWYEKLRRDICFAGQSKEVFDQIYPDIEESNRKIMLNISSLGLVAGLFLYSATFWQSFLLPSRNIYISIVVASILVKLVCQSRLRHNTHVLRMTGLAMVCYLLGVGMLMSTKIDTPAVSFVCFLIGVPMLLADSVWVMSLIIFLASASFLAMSHTISTHSYFLVNVINVCAYGVLSLMLFFIMSRATVQRIADHKHLEQEKEKNAKIQGNLIMALSSIIEENAAEKNNGGTLRSEYLLEQMLETLALRKHYRKVVTPSYIEKVLKAFPFRELGRIRKMQYGKDYRDQFPKSELMQIRLRCKEGGMMIERSLSGLQDEEISLIARNMVVYSHENWDGSGLEGLKGEEIPLESRLVNLIETFEGLTSKGMTEADAIKLIQSRIGIWFDPTLVDVFTEVAGLYANYEKLEL